MQSLASLALSPDPNAPGEARAALRAVPELNPVREDAELVISELVTNAILHSGAIKGDEITVEVLREDDVIRLSVHDPGRSLTSPEVLEPDLDRAGGVGLLVVSRVAERWLTERPDGVIVWAELSLS
ncbi:MAG TPA: ATP-binding protein [Solirubrobacteraceae bacterium]